MTPCADCRRVHLEGDACGGYSLAAAALAAHGTERLRQEAQRRTNHARLIDDALRVARVRLKLPDGHDIAASPLDYDTDAPQILLLVDGVRLKYGAGGGGTLYYLPPGHDLDADEWVHLPSDSSLRKLGELLERDLAVDARRHVDPPAEDGAGA